MAIALAAVAVLVGGGFLLRRTDDVGRFLGPLVYILGQLGLAVAMFRAMVGRAEHFAAQGVPSAWTRPPLRGVTDADQRRWQNTIRDLRDPWPAERDTLLTAARARADGLPSIVVPGLLLALFSVAGVVVMGRVADSPLSALLVPNLILGLLLGMVAARYAFDGHRARVYLRKFLTPR